jgi:hypothetical protein
MRVTLRGVCLLAVLVAGCARPAPPTAPSPATGSAQAQEITLEAEAGTGDGDLHHRAHASGALTIHLAPGQRRLWTVTAARGAASYAVFVTYSNDNPGETELLRVEVDGRLVGKFRAQDTGDDGAGWEIFVDDLAGSSALPGVAHTISVESSGGDGCIEIDKVTLKPTS